MLKRAAPYLVCCAVVLLAGSWVTWPVAGRFADSYAGGRSDQCVALWDVHWVQRVVLEGRDPLHTADLFFPDGTSLAFHSISWVSGLLALPGRVLFGPVVGYNLLFAGQMLLCAGFMFALLQHIYGRPPASLLGALTFALSPVRLDEAANHPNLAGTFFLPLLLLGWHRGVTHGRWRDAALVAAALALTLLTGVHLFTMGSLSLLVFATADALLARRLRERGFWRFVARSAGLSALACALPAAQFLLHLGQLDDALSAVTTSGRATDPAALWLAPPARPVLGELASTLGVKIGARDARAYLGLLPTALALWGLLRASTARRATIAHAIAAVVLLVLSMGSTLHLAGKTTDLRLPLSLLETLTPIASLRHPDRLLLVFSTHFSVLVAAGATRLRRGPWGILLAGALALGIAGEYRGGDYRTDGRRADRVYARLPDDGRALVELPLRREWGKHAMCQQLHHGRPLVGGMVARPTRDTGSYISRTPILEALRGGRPNRARCPQLDARSGWQTLRDDGVGYVVVKRPFLKRYRKVFDGYFGDVRPSTRSHTRTVYAVDDLARAAPTCATQGG
ncbi:MAG: hypothetical protein PVI30_07095 [Myxococcales bacterium]